MYKLSMPSCVVLSQPNLLKCLCSLPPEANLGAETTDNNYLHQLFLVGGGYLGTVVVLYS